MVFAAFIITLRQEEYEGFLKAVFIPWFVLVFVKSAASCIAVSIDT